MAFGPIMRFTVGELRIELAPLERELMGEFIDHDHGGGMHRLGVTRYMGIPSTPVLEDELEWFDNIRQAKTDLLWGIWVVEGESRTLIGNSSLNGIGDDGHSGLIRQATSGSMIFRPEYWGKGIASAAHKARALYAFKYLGLHRLKSTVIQDNGGSIKALGRSGYIYSHTERNDQFVDGKFHHLDHFECLNPLDLFWSQWWHGDRPPAVAQRARKATQEAIDWAEQNVELP